MRSSSHIVSNSTHDVVGVVTAHDLNADNILRSSADKGSSSWVSQYARDKFIRKAIVDRGSSSNCDPSKTAPGIASAAVSGEPYHHNHQIMDGRQRKDSDSGTTADRTVSDYHDVVHSVTSLRPLILVTKREDVLLITVERSVLFYTKVRIRSGSSGHGGHRSRIVRLIIRPSQRYTVQFGAVVDDGTTQEVRLIVRTVLSKEDNPHYLSPSTDRLIEASSFTFHDEFSEQQLLVFAHSPSLRSFQVNSLPSSSASDGKDPRLPSVIVQLLHKIVKALSNIKCQVPKRIFYFSTPSFRVSTIPSVENHHSSRGSSLREQEAGQTVDCKCMLMCNDPLPDFYIQWVDGVKLRYVLQTGRVRIDTGTTHSQLYWEGLLHLNNADAPIRPGSLGTDAAAPIIAAQFIPYLQVAQRAFRRCLSEQEQDRDHHRMRSSTSSSSSCSQTVATTMRPKILVL